MAGLPIFRFPKVKTSTSIRFLHWSPGRFAGILASISADETPPSLSSACGKQIDKRRLSDDLKLLLATFDQVIFVYKITVII